MKKIVHKNFNKKKTEETIKFYRYYYMKGVDKYKSGAVLQDFKRG